MQPAAVPLTPADPDPDEVVLEQLAARGLLVERELHLDEVLLRIFDENVMGDFYLQLEHMNRCNCRVARQMRKTALRSF